MSKENKNFIVIKHSSYSPTRTRRMKKHCGYYVGQLSGVRWVSYVGWITLFGKQNRKIGIKVLIIMSEMLNMETRLEENVTGWKWQFEERFVLKEKFYIAFSIVGHRNFKQTNKKSHHANLRHILSIYV